MSKQSLNVGAFEPEQRSEMGNAYRHYWQCVSCELLPQFVDTTTKPAPTLSADLVAEYADRMAGEWLKRFGAGVQS